MCVLDIAKTIQERLECYQHLYSEDIQEVLGNLQTLSPGSDEDCTSFYLLKLKTFDHARLRQVFAKNELKLMELRLSNYTEIDLKQFVKNLRSEAQDFLVRHRKYMSKEKEKTCLECVHVSLLFLRQGALEHAFKYHKNDEFCEDCDNFCIQMDFETCLDLVASSKYHINNRKLYIYNFQWKQIILALFKTYLINSLKEIKANEQCKNVLAEPRMSMIFFNVQGALSQAFPQSSFAKSGSFSQSSIDNVFVDFPPCIRHLYDVLQRDNRLPHQARFDFSVFLKDIGLSLEEQLSFWEAVYMKDPGENAKCTHTWEKHNKHYIYSIRHIYGLEGSKLETCVKSCTDIEDIKLAVNEEGGCPFAHDDDHNLKKILKKCLPNNPEDIEVIIHERKLSAQKGCQAYFYANMLKRYKYRVPDDEINFQNPAEFYLLTEKFSTKNDEDKDFFETSSSSDEEGSNNFLAVRPSSSSDDDEANNEKSFSSSFSSDKECLARRSDSSSDGFEDFSSQK
ncbi:unnamed protein product [Ceutorhynchus assimilis]|uniref:DNA primase large subunit C-terminal domain-containing protein n=1 Tax=Ceutorhynchus assimilis TaxID=467358 RepID=A0A9N9MIK7_9CUCU|nr:unnamed protein product [Ceutorhynchus assimilis]